ncbi:MAG TPA: CNNM domain-containing protein [Candidatus Saccharimonadales bacterium]|nr:CNNM domain-containing protein [Candidatus Saccharimonadales bacterium]
MHIAAIALLVAVLVLLSAVCSGLNVALVSLDLADLRRKAKLGNRDAKAALPFRRNTHLSLVAILLTNIAVVSATSLVLDHAFAGNHLLAGFAAGAISTILIVIFGEVFPQAFFSRRALPLFAKLAPFMRVMIFVSYPLAKPLQLLLDRLLPRERAPLQSRQELGLIMAEHQNSSSSELDDDEVEIIRGALQLSEKRVRDIMTDIRHVYWLMPETLIDADRVDQIKEQGFSRIPIFDKALTRCYGVLLMKDLVDIDFDEQPQRVEDLPLYPSQLIGSMTALDTMFRKFIASGTHLLPVERDDKIAGIVTIEDLIEEIVGHEIEDETDRQLGRS